MAKYEVLLLNEKWSARSNDLPFESSSSLESIRDRRLRDTLHNDYKTVTRETRNTMMAMYMECAEKQKEQCQLEYDTAMANTLDRQRTLPFDERLTLYMCKLIQKRLRNVSEGLECDFEFQIELFRLSRSCSVQSSFLSH
jgi:UV DNA damage repair endonuclease